MLKKKMTNPPDAVALSEMEAKPYIDQLQGLIPKLNLIYSKSYYQFIDSFQDFGTLFL